jgi:mannose-1-phosphate guanylyltransferase
MAGGTGTRFWPLSRQRTPKQALNIIGDNSLIQDTVNRVSSLAPIERTYIVTNRSQYKILAPQLPLMTGDNFLMEPTQRNTAPCIGLAAIHIQKRDPDGIMIVLPSDHLIADAESFRRVVQTGIEVVMQYDSIVTIGIKPSRPEIGYGYIQFNSPDPKLPKGVYHVKAFAEKPNRQTAELFMKSGDFYWNSGIFMWSARRILCEMEEHLPEHYHQLHRIQEAIGTSRYQRVLVNRYRRMRPISIDYGIMEVSTAPIYMIAGEFGWSDIGSWDELYRISSISRNGNVIFGESATIDAKENLIYSPNKLTAVIGMDHFLIVNTPNATLICPRDRAQDVKLLVEKLRQEKRKKYL